MNWIQEKLYYRVQSYYTSLQATKIKSELGLSTKQYFRPDLLNTMQRIIGSITTCRCLIDVGANKGEFAQIFQACLKVDQLICIEPNRTLNKYIEKNNAGSNLVILNYAISDRNGEADFYFHDDSQMSSLSASENALLRRDFWNDNPDKIYSEKVAVRTLDDTLMDRMNELVSGGMFLKIDTQGNEREVLAGSIKILPLVKYCLLEYMFQSPYNIRHSFVDILDFMESNGFGCKGPVHASYRATHEPGAVLFLFIKN